MNSLPIAAKKMNAQLQHMQYKMPSFLDDPDFKLMPTSIL